MQTFFSRRCALNYYEENIVSDIKASCMAGRMPANLDSLPFEVRSKTHTKLLWRVLLYSRSASLAHVCKTLWHACALAPRSVKAEYLFCCWLDSYNLRFQLKASSSMYAPAMQRKFIPTTYPSFGASNALRRTATCDILTFVSRFGICTSEIFALVERIVIHATLCGNICQLHGIFTHCPDGTQQMKPIRIACHFVPERLFRKMVIAKMPLYLHDAHVSEQRIVRSIVRHICDLTPVYIQENDIRLPPWRHLEMISRMILLHQASPNSSQGYPLAMAVHLGSTPLVCLLLATGADPSLKKGIAMHIACKKRSLSMLRLLVEQDDTSELQWRTRLRAIVDDLIALTLLRTTGKIPPQCKRALPMKGATPSKRSRLSDRCQVDTCMLSTAVQVGAWDIVSYLMQSKGVIPDVNTLRKIDEVGIA